MTVVFWYCWAVQLYDYQYNMGLLLLQRKTWTSQVDELKAAVVDAEEILQREKAAHLLELSEVMKREEAAKNALDTEKQCVADVSIRCSFEVEGYLLIYIMNRSLIKLPFVAACPLFLYFLAPLLYISLFSRTKCLFIEIRTCCISNMSDQNIAGKLFLTWFRTIAINFVHECSTINILSFPVYAVGEGT